MTHLTCRLTAKNRDQLRNPTLGNRVWATFAFYVTSAKHSSVLVLSVYSFRVSANEALQKVEMWIILKGDALKD